MWAGCPMVTLPLQRMASRVAASLCTATGLGTEMVVGSQEEYEEKVWARGEGLTCSGRRLVLLALLMLACRRDHQKLAFWHLPECFSKFVSVPS